MKKVIIISISLLMLLFSDIKAQNFSIDGNTYIENKKETTIEKGNTQKTPYNYCDTKGNIYPIYININSGRCFIYKVSNRTFKEYKKYLEPEMARNICRKMKVEYKEKTR